MSSAVQKTMIFSYCFMLSILSRHYKHITSSFYHILRGKNKIFPVLHHVHNIKTKILQPARVHQNTTLCIYSYRITLHCRYEVGQKKKEKQLTLKNKRDRTKAGGAVAVVALETSTDKGNFLTLYSYRTTTKQRSYSSFKILIHTPCGITCKYMNGEQEKLWEGYTWNFSCCCSSHAATSQSFLCVCERERKRERISLKLY